MSASAQFIAKNKYRYPKDILTHNTKACPPVFETFPSMTKQLMYLVHACQQSTNLNDIAILYRQNVSALSLIEMFERFNIPFRMTQGHMSFFTHPIVKDIEALITFASNKQDIPSFRRISRLLYLPATLVQAATRTQATDLLYESIQNGHALKSYQLDKLKRFNRDLSALLTLPPKRALHFILETLQYRSYLIKRGLLKEESDATFTQGLSILSTLKLIADSVNTLSDFLARLSHLQTLSTQSPEQAVTLLTFHSAKGLEFDTVYLLDCMNGITPPQSILADRQKLGDVASGYEEERRLFYVAFTRAKRHIELLSVEFNDSITFSPSDFLVELQQLTTPQALTQPKTRHAPLQRTLLTSLDLSDYQPKTHVHHLMFGDGTIQHVEGEIATIAFQDDTRRISLRITLENKTLTRLT